MHNKEIARMHFKSSDKPYESGYLTLHEDGFVHMKPQCDPRDGGPATYRSFFLFSRLPQH
jgi:hypothetical protein